MAESMLTKDQSFSCSMSQGIVPPGENKYLSLFFHPKTLDSRAIDYFSIIPSGCATKTLLQVVGFSRGNGCPRMSPSPDCEHVPPGSHSLERFVCSWSLVLGVCCPLVAIVGKHLVIPSFHTVMMELRALQGSSLAIWL